MAVLEFIKSKYRTIEILIISLIICIGTWFIYTQYTNSRLILLFGFILFVINFARIWFYKQMDMFFSLIVKYRYIVAAFIFIFCVTFKLHGSSISNYNTIFTNLSNPSDTGVVFGNGRAIRFDEYNVQTPYYFSQSYNDFKEKSHQMSIGGQDMIIGYNAPVKNITLIGKPFTWGYMMFDNEYGLSWYWSLKTILFVLMAFECCYILTKGNQKLSFLGSLLIVFSPSMQWWFSPHMYDVFFWATTLLVVGYYFFMARMRWQKILFTILAPCCLIGFVLALFPSCQIPLGLIALVLMIVFIVRDKEQFKFDKIDILRVAFVVVVAGLVLGSFLLTAGEEVKMLSQTVYPGSRISVGGDMKLADLFTDLTNIRLPYKDSNVADNCAVSTFNHLGPLFMLYFPFLFYKLRKIDKKNIAIGSTLFIILCIEAWFMLVGFPEWLSKITLFSYINRMKIVYGFTATLFTIWNFNMIVKYFKKINKKVFFGCSLVFGILYFSTITASNIEYMSLKFYILEIIGFIMIAWLFILKKKTLAGVCLMLVIVVSSFTINPIAVGASPIYNHPISQKVEELINEDDGNWIYAGGPLDIQNFLLANGAKVINSTNFYPDYEKWKLIDPDFKNDFYYNRYAHITVNLITEETNYHVITGDWMVINMNYEDFKKWNPRYLMVNTTDGLRYEKEFGTYGIKAQLKFRDDVDGFSIYSLEY